MYSADLNEFLQEDAERILGVLTSAGEARGFTHQDHMQTRAWREQIRVLKSALPGLDDTGLVGIAMEYPIPRRGKRIDAVLTTPKGLVVLEFKEGADAVVSAAREQVEDYSLDLRDFHSTSQGVVLWPIVVATKVERTVSPSVGNDVVRPTAISSSMSLRQNLETILYSLDGTPAPTIQHWIEGRYRPTPTIIEAACQLYSKMDVADIAHSQAGQGNLFETSQAVLYAIEKAQENNQKVICFITGVPGAGKTLAGLNIVHNRELHEGESLGVFLSGNGPLVKVLREALAQDEADRTGIKLGEARRKASTFVQNMHGFMDHHGDGEIPPPDRVVIFDEAQRAWNAAHSWRKFRRPASEPSMFLEIMSRHEGWATVVALVGGGQEIHTGEAGLGEWGRVLRDEYPDWSIAMSDRLVEGDHSTGGKNLFESWPDDLEIEENGALHLSVSLRAYRAERLSDWVATVLDGDSSRAAQIAESDLKDYPLVLTRDLVTVRDWLTSKRRGTRRSGLVASSGARRLRPHGIDVKADLGVEHWFLNPPSDVRSSSFLELAVTEFHIQGLEVDYAGLCWGGDLRRKGDQWTFHQFRGTKWQSVNNPERQQYLINKYRVLMTRAREGLVVWVPKGDPNDVSRSDEVYDGAFQYLIECGMCRIPD